MINCPNCGTQSSSETLTFCSNCGINLRALTGQLAADTMMEGRYNIVKALGKGGMGAVYLAIDTRLDNSLVAIKEMSSASLGEGNLTKAIEAFKKEASILINLRHQSLPRIIDFFSVGDYRWYLVMDYTEGETLEDILKRKGPQPEEDVLNWAIQICNILDYLHSLNPPLIFRDLKPSNIMLTPQGVIKLIDFGIARHFRNDSAFVTTTYGSQGYSPPEQYGQQQTDIRADIYALGATLHQLVTGINPSQSPFNFKLPSEIVKISPFFEEAIMKALEFKPENRPENVKILLEMLLNKPAETQISNLPSNNLPLGKTVPLTVQAVSNNLNHNQDNKKVKSRQYWLYSLSVAAILFISLSSYYYFQVVKDKNKVQSSSTEGGKKKINNPQVGLQQKYGSTNNQSDTTNHDNKIDSVSNQTTKYNANIEKQNIEGIIANWISTLEEGNVENHMEYYANFVDSYYTQKNVTKTQIYNSKKIMVDKYDYMYYDLNKLAINIVNSDMAEATFNKKWDAGGKETFSGEEIQKLEFRKFNGEWKIYKEIEVKIFWVYKNGKKIV